MEPDEPGLVWYWLEFDLSGLQPQPPEPGVIRLDGEPLRYRFLWRGIGVTGYDKHDCLDLVAAQAGGPLPPVIRSVRKPRIDPAHLGPTGNPAWRGVWFPALNLVGPVIGTVQPQWRDPQEKPADRP